MRFVLCLHEFSMPKWKSSVCVRRKCEHLKLVWFHTHTHTQFRKKKIYIYIKRIHAERSIETDSLYVMEIFATIWYQFVRSVHFLSFFRHFFFTVTFWHFVLSIQYLPMSCTKCLIYWTQLVHTFAMNIKI